MGILFIIYVILLLLFILYLIIFKYFNKNVRDNLKNNTEPTSSTSTINELNRINCREKKIYCLTNNDCLQMCTHATDNELLIQYKCSSVNVCTQSILNNDDENTKIICNRKHGFFPIITADEIFQPRWTCLNTRPYLFNKNQEYHSYICAGGDRSKLDPDNIFNSCNCSSDKIKVRDEFRNDIPICIEQKKLSLFPNFTEK